MGDERTCGTCKLCCVVFHVPALPKPAGILCHHHTGTAGCGIYPTRPEGCRLFYCHWLNEPSLDAEWKPEISGFVLSVDPNTGNLEARTAPGFPDAWRQPAYEQQFRRWAEHGMADFRHVVVFSDGNVTVVLPEGEVAGGPIARGQHLHISRVRGADGTVRLEVDVRTPEAPQSGA